MAGGSHNAPAAKQYAGHQLAVQCEIYVQTPSLGGKKKSTKPIKYCEYLASFKDRITPLSSIGVFIIRSFLVCDD